MSAFTTLSPAEQQAVLLARELGTADLLAHLDALQAQLHDLSTFAGAAPVVRLRIDEQIAVASAEIDRRRQLAERGAPVRHPNDYAAWRNLAAAVREQADLVSLCVAWGIPLVKRGQREWHGPCPFCRAGVDRFIVFTATNSAWCRRCGFSGDVIGLYRSLHQLHFHAAVTALAHELCLPVPDAWALDRRDRVRQPPGHPPGRRWSVPHDEERD